MKQHAMRGETGIMRVAAVVGLATLWGTMALAADWPQWLGPNRDAISADVPQELPAKKLVWSQPMGGEEMYGGIAVANGYAIVPDCKEATDIFYCFNAETGKEVWKHEYENTEELDYGSGPRATPLIADGRVYTLGANGEFHCLDLATGKVIWQINLIDKFDGSMPDWGYCSSPLITDGKLIIDAGGTLLALDPKTGEPIWKSKDYGASYSSFIVTSFGGVTQLVGYDGASIGGWDLATGKRLWTVEPPNGGDYNVGTPMNIGGKMFVATENNFSRLYTFGAKGVINEEPVAVNEDLAPDTATPIAYKGMVFGTANGGLYCLDAANDLQRLWVNEDYPKLQGFSTLIAGNDRVMVFTDSGTMYLFAADGKQYTEIGKMDLCKTTWAYPALANGLLYVRDSKAVYCYRMK